MKKPRGPVRFAAAACIGVALFAGASLAAPAAKAGVHVTIYAPVAPPPPRVEVRPARPGPHAVWIDGHWRWVDGRHVWVAGHWDVPPPHYHTWVAGHWRQTPRGWVWVDGHWR